MIYRDNKQLITEFKKILLDNNIKLQDIATAIGITKQNLSGLLGKKHLTFDDLQRLLSVAGYDLQFDFTRKTD